MKRQPAVFLALAAALVWLPGCAAEDDVYDADLEIEAEETGEPLIGDEMERPVGTFELDEEGAVDVEDEDEDEVPLAE